MSTGQLVRISGITSKEKYGVIVQVMLSTVSEDAYIVLIENELLILTDSDIAEI